MAFCYQDAIGTWSSHLGDEQTLLKLFYHCGLVILRAFSDRSFESPAMCLHRNQRNAKGEVVAGRGREIPQGWYAGVGR